ncbi:MAG: NAD(P)H-binding protein [Balneolaceae bacterium]|nr:NAD(P)H-binding protein [Balneolaceae bacterium]MBO6545463.1 NAD(P)H-binding protein [Balneolaceae bacterium]MBO6646859.1 NAD(P)H-binding protein [Balneolaceae bacterium]
MKNLQEKTAIIIGATGLVGSHILQLLLSDERYSKVLVFHRRSTGVSHPKLTEHIINFDAIEDWKELLVGNELYSALGTTIKQAGSQEAQWTIDYDYQFEVAKAAAQIGVESYALVSSIGATAETGNFYLKMKGQLDEEVQELGFKKTLIVRPSFLKGERIESRFLEKIGITAAELFTKIPGLKKYKPIHAKQVAQALINGLNDSDSKTMYEGDEVFGLSGK